jgi:hydrogenase expression/formation protein HypC
MSGELPVCGVTDGCITCGDIAVSLTVLELRGADAWCRDDEGRTELVAIELVAELRPGDLVLVHAGVALERLRTDEEDRTDALRR